MSQSSKPATMQITAIFYFFAVQFVSVFADDTCALANVKDYSAWISDDLGRLQFPGFNEEAASVEEGDHTFNGTYSTSCALGAGSFWNRSVACIGSLDYDFIDFLRKWLVHVPHFIVYDYNVPQAYKPTQPLKAPESQDVIHLNDYKYKATGDVSSEIGIGMKVSVELIPNSNFDGYAVTGDAFSNELRVGWKIEGNLTLREVNGSIRLQTNASTVGDGGWKISGECPLLLNLGVWNCSLAGTIDADFLPTTLIYAGPLQSSLNNDSSWQLTGKVRALPIIISWSVDAVITPNVNEHITIPKMALNKVHIEHLLFNNSYFMGDFDKDALQGVKGLKTITFLNSKLEEIPRLDYLLHNLVDLEAVYFEGSTMPDFEMGITSSLPSLQLLSFKGSGPLQLNTMSFYWLRSSNLTYLNFQDCNINVASKAGSILLPVRSTLRYLDLSYTSLTDETDIQIMLTGLNITHLSLAGLQLSKVPKKALEKISSSTQYLTLRSNQFHKVPEQNMFSLILDFPAMPNLEELDLERCGINYIEGGVFDQLPGLKKLYLAYNYVENIPDGWSCISPSLLHIDLSWNGASNDADSVKSFNLQPGEGLHIFQSLQTVDLSNAYMKYPEKMVSGVANTTKQLSLCNTNLPDDNALISLYLPDLENLDLSGNPAILFGSDEIMQFLHSLTSLKTLYARNNKITSTFFTAIRDFATNNNLTELIKPLETLDLKGNSIKTLTPSSFSYFPNLKKVDLSESSITAWSEQILTLSKLETLILIDNKIETLTKAMFNDLTKLKEAQLARNPFVCDCSMETLTRKLGNGNKLCHITGGLSSGGNVFMTLTEHRRRVKLFGRKCVEFTDWPMDNTDYYCYAATGEDMHYLGSLNSSDLCVGAESITDVAGVTNFNVIYVGVAVFLTIALVLAFIYWKWWEIRLITRAVRNATILTFLDTEEQDYPPLQYSAFVSYSDKDRPWVLQNLLPRLEEWTDVNVCLHERDFQVGLSIMENITYCMERSRNLVLVLSEAFIRSQWCQFELHLAQHRLIESRRERLVLVVLESIPSYRKPKTLRYLMRTNTYLEWPGEGKQEEVERFWSRLIKSLAVDEEV